jgi:hypothetical protein
MSRDVDQSAARANALKTLDQRNAANAPSPSLPPLNDTLRQSQSPLQQPPLQQPSPGYRAPPYPGQAPVYQQPASSGNGLMSGVLGFMLGRAMSQSHQPVAYPATNGSQPAPQPTTATAGVDGAGMVAGMPGLGMPTAATAVTPATPAAQPSFAAGVLRWFAWLAVLSVLIWAAVYSVRKLRRLRATPNYSFERN